MSNKNTGGPAFPWTGCGEEGMTLLDYFAAKVMQAVITNPIGAEEFTFIGRATWAYLQADAMLAVREVAA